LLPGRVQGYDGREEKHPRRHDQQRPPAVRVWLAAAPVDLRRSFDRLATEVGERLHNDPLSGYVYVFRNKRGDRPLQRRGDWIRTSDLLNLILGCEARLSCLSVPPRTKEVKRRPRKRAIRVTLPRYSNSVVSTA
jgi:hypothetical protein